MDSFTFMFGHYKKICFNVYLAVMAMAFFSFVLALFLSYQQPLNLLCVFDDNNTVGFSFMGILVYLAPLAIIICTPKQQMTTQNFPHWLNIFMFLPIYINMINYGRFISTVAFALNILIFSFCFWLGIYIKRSLVKLHSKINIFVGIFFALVVIGMLFSSTILTFIAYFGLSLSGALYTLYEAQFLKLRLLNLKERQDFFRIINAGILNFSCNFYLMYIWGFINYFLIKINATKAYISIKFSKD